MALARTDIGLYESKASIGTAAFTTPSFTPPANSLLLIAVGFVGNATTGDLGTPLIEGGGLSYTLRESAFGSAAWSMKLAVFTASVGAEPKSMTITVDDDNNQNIFGYSISVVAFTGYATATPVAGATGSGSTNIGDGEEKETLSATPASEDVTMSWVLIDGEPGPPKPTMATGWTKIHEGKVGGEGGLYAMRREASTSTEVKITDVWTGGTFFKGAMASLIVKAAKEEGKALKIEISDAGKGADSLGSGETSTLADAGKGSDAKTTAASSTLSDAGKGADSASSAATGTLSDSGKGSDQAATGTTAALTDSGKGADALSGALGAALSDAGRGADALTGKASVGLSDGGVGVDALAGFMAAALADAGVGRDEAEVILGEPDFFPIHLPTAATLDPQDYAVAVDASDAAVTIEANEVVATIEAAETRAEVQSRDCAVSIDTAATLAATIDPPVLYAAEVM